MGENIKKFIQTFDEFAKAKVDFADQHLKEFNKARAEAIALKTPVNDEYKTLGELLAKIFSEDGKFNNQLFQNVYSKLSLEKSDQDIFSQVFKVKNAPITYQKAVDFQKIGGETYFNQIAGALGSMIARSGALGSKITFNEIIGANSGEDENKKISNFGKVIDSLEDKDGNSIDIPSKLANSSSLYYAMVENGDPLGKNKETSPSPINETEKKSEATPTSPATGSAVNPEKAIAGEKTEVQKTEGQVTASAPEVPKELEKPQKTPININLEAPAPAEPGPTSSTSVSSTTNVVNQSTTTNVTNESKEQVTQSSNNLSPSTQNLSQTTISAPTSQINDASIKKTVTEGAKNLVTTSTKNLTSQIFDLDKKFGVDQTSLMKLGSAATINSIPTGETKNEESTTTKEEKTTSLNETKGKESQSTSSTPVSASINETKPSSTSTGKYEALLAAAKQFGINTEKYEVKNTQTTTTVSEPEGNSEITTTEKSSLPKPMEVTKSMVSLPTEPKPAVQTQAKPTVELTQSSVGSTEKTEPVAATPIKEEANSTQPAPTASTTRLDLSSLENRLMRIEYLLSNTLEVKIID